MPLLIGDVRLSHDIKVQNLFDSFESLKVGSEEFIKNNITKKIMLSKEHRVLYVFQREYATVSPQNSSISWISSDDATTCHIVVLIETTTGSVSLGHFDGSDTYKGLDNMIKSLIELVDSSHDNLTSSHSIDLYIFGGFLDKKKYSEKLFKDIMLYLVKCEYRINLKLAPAWQVNSQVDNDTYKPFILGVAVNIKTKEIVIAENENPGPDLLLREARIFGGGNNKMINIFDFNTEEIIIKPFHYNVSEYAYYLLNLPPEKYLQIMSTSPDCEPSHFVKRSKDAIRFTMKYPNPWDDVFNGNVRKYRLQKDHVWKLV